MQKHSNVECLKKLVLYKLEEIRVEFAKVMSTFHLWFQELVDELDAGSILSSSDWCLLKESIVSIMVQASSSFDRRVVSPLLKFPLLLFVMIKHEPHVECQERKGGHVC